MRGLVTKLPPIISSATSVAWPALPTGRAATLLNLVQELDRTQWLEPHVMRRAQFTQLATLASAVVSKTPAFRARLERAGLQPADLRSPEGLQQLPPVTRDDLVAAGDAAFATAVPAGHGAVRQAKTSGSTGTPITVHRTGVSAIVWDALTIRDHLWRGIDFGERVLANRFGVREVVDRDMWGPPISSLFASAPLRATPLLDGVDALVAQCLEFEPELLVVYPSMLDELLVALRLTARSLPELRYVHTYAEPLAPATRSASAAIAPIVWETYSCEEVGIIASSCPDGDDSHILAEAVLVEVLRDDDRPCRIGEVGRVVVTDLNNAATPLIRYDVGDYAVAAAPCRCGRGLPPIGAVLGRGDNRMRLPDGRLVFPDPPALVELQDIAPVRQIDLVQRRGGEIDGLVVSDETLPLATIEALASRIAARLGGDADVRLARSTERIRRTRGGKLPRFRREDEPEAR